MEDQQIVELLLARKEQGIVALTEKYGKLCRRIARNILNNEDDVKECENDVYLHVWNAVLTKPPRSLLAYLSRITRNFAISRYKRDTAAKRNSQYDIALSELEACLSTGENVEDSLQAKELSQVLQAFLDEQSASDRAMFICRYYYSETPAQIAERLRKSAHYVTVRLSRMRSKLQKYFIEKGVLE